jgi:hypothetical protein
MRLDRYSRQAIYRTSWREYLRAGKKKRWKTFCALTTKRDRITKPPSRGGRVRLEYPTTFRLVFFEGMRPLAFFLNR